MPPAPSCTRVLDLRGPLDAELPQRPDALPEIARIGSWLGYLPIARKADAVRMNDPPKTLAVGAPAQIGMRIDGARNRLPKEVRRTKGRQAAQHAQQVDDGRVLDRVHVFPPMAAACPGRVVLGGESARRAGHACAALGFAVGKGRLAFRRCGRRAGARGCGGGLRRARGTARRRRDPRNPGFGPWPNARVVRSGRSAGDAGRSPASSRPRARTRPRRTSSSAPAASTEVTSTCSHESWRALPTGFDCTPSS